MELQVANGGTLTVNEVVFGPNLMKV